jgi:hypothetical protein
MTLFIAVMGSDWLLARRIRKAVALQRLHSPDLENTRFGGSPIGIILNLFRMRKIPAANELSDPDHIAIRRHLRMHHVLVALLVACFGAALLLRSRLDSSLVPKLLKG